MTYLSLLPGESEDTKINTTIFFQPVESCRNNTIFCSPWHRRSEGINDSLHEYILLQTILTVVSAQANLRRTINYRYPLIEKVCQFVLIKLNLERPVIAATTAAAA